MKLKDFKNLEPKDTVILNDGKTAQVEIIHRGMTGKFIAELICPDNMNKIFKTHRQIREKVNCN